MSLLVKEFTNEEAPMHEEIAKEGHSELIEFLELAQDAEAIQAYRSLAYYWTTLQSGLGLINGDLEFEIPIDEED